jgi:crotonobetainyl-CoA:carnitine CoA-transferase CaiB-like acyl-CoA transferase
VPDRAFPALDGDVFVTAHDDAQWRGFCEAIERPDLAADPRFSTNADRVANRAALDAIALPIFAARPMIWWMRACERRKVPCAMAQNFEQLRYHAQVRDNGMIAEVSTADWGTVVVGGLPWHFAQTPGAVLPPPIPGADTARVLASLGRVPADANKGKS